MITINFEQLSIWKDASLNLLKVGEAGKVSPVQYGNLASWDEQIQTEALLNFVQIFFYGKKDITGHFDTDPWHCGLLLV